MTWTVDCVVSSSPPKRSCEASRRLFPARMRSWLGRRAVAATRDTATPCGFATSFTSVGLGRQATPRPSPSWGRVSLWGLGWRRSWAGPRSTTLSMSSRTPTRWLTSVCSTSSWRCTVSAPRSRAMENFPTPFHDFLRTSSPRRFSTSGDSEERSPTNGSQSCDGRSASRAGRARGCGISRPIPCRMPFPEIQSISFSRRPLCATW